MRLKNSLDKIWHRNKTHDSSKRRMLRSHVRAFTILLMALVLVACLLAGVNALRIRNTNLSQLRAGLPNWTPPQKDERVLVIAPHCDDETLGCGGIIRDLVREGAQVQVVIATNGDGFRYAVAREYHNINVSPAQYIEFGYTRQQESINVLQDMGLDTQDIIFLGYPDGGLSRMWIDYWHPKKLFRSPYTEDRCSPYTNSFRRNAPFCGQSMLSDLKTIIESFKPTTVYCPHPCDHHPDHWATNCFITQALYETGMLDEVRLGLYIVHRGDWPVPQGQHRNLPLVPPGFLADTGTEWFEYDLNDNEVRQKLEDILMYKTQLPVLGRFLKSFARKNELFGLYPPGEIEATDRMTGVNDPRWQTMGPSIEDPISDSLDVDFARGGDLRDIKCCYDDSFVYVRLNLAHGRSARISYYLRLRTLPDGDGDRINILVRRKRCNTRGVRVKVGPSAIQLAIPRSMLGDWEALMISADSYYKRYAIDRTAWRLFRPGRKQTALAK